MDPRKLYFAAGLLAAGIPVAVLETIPEAQSKPIIHQAVVYMDVGAAAGATLDTFLAAQFCPKVEEVFALPAESCNTAMLDSQEASYTLVKRDSDGDGALDKWSINRGMSRSGSFVPD